MAEEILPLRRIVTGYDADGRAIVTMDEIVAYLRDRESGGKRILDDAMLVHIAEYRATYGA